MRREKVISNYYRLRDSELATMAGKVLGALEGNGHFTDLTPPLPELKVLIEDYQTKHEVASRGGSVLEVSLKNESRETLLNALRILAHHVNMVADGRLTLLNSTGLILAKQPTRVNIPGVIERLTLKDAALTGQVRLDFTRIKEAWEYEITVGGLDIDGKLEWIQTHSSTNSKGIVLSPF